MPGRRIAAALALGCAALFGPPAEAQQLSGGTPTASSSTWSAPQRRRIILMRHGDVTYFDAQGQRVGDPDKVVLSDKGKAQADATGRHLVAMGVKTVDRVISSSLPRTIETAERVLTAAGFKGEVRQVAALREIKNGPASAVPTDRLAAEMLALAQGRVAAETKFLGGESVGDMQARIFPAVEALLAETGWDTALLVLHGVVNNALISEALTGSREFYGRFDMGAGCFSILDVGPTLKDAVVKAVNVCPDASPYATRLKTLEALLEQAMKGRK
jgi:probable phosphoglycerate mutase